MFAGVFEVALAIPREFQEHRLLRARFISCVHRLVDGLQVRFPLAWPGSGDGGLPPAWSGSGEGVV